MLVQLVSDTHTPETVPQSAADLFVDVLHPSGCRAVIFTGGVGRETAPLWDELAKVNYRWILSALHLAGVDQVLLCNRKLAEAQHGGCSAG